MSQAISRSYELCMYGWSMTSDNVLMGLYLAKPL
jgi:hypothetical protein